MDHGEHRPKGFQGQGDSHLPQIVRQLQKTLSKAHRGFAYDTLRLPPKAMGELAGILVDFAEDLHNGSRDMGSLRTLQRRVLRHRPSPDLEKSGPRLHPDRFLHFLWVLYPAFIDGLTLSPTHQDLRRVADAISTFLSDAFSAVPKDSGVKAFLGTPNAYGWDVKRKLIWLGTHSFLFRTQFACYMEEQPPKDRKSRIPTTSCARSVPVGPGWGLSTSWRESSTFPPTTARTYGVGTSVTPRSTDSYRSATKRWKR